MQLDINLLRSFVAIAENGSFIAAAERVAKSPSSITMQIKRLEDIIGEPLFNRDARTTRLTRAGERLLPQARRMLSMEAEILAAFQGDDAPGPELDEENDEKDHIGLRGQRIGRVEPLNAFLE